MVRPSLLHVIAQGKMPGGILKLQYLGHGVHYSAVKKSSSTEPDPDPEPVVEPEEPYGATCKMSCAGASPDYTCYCDESCVESGDCCEDSATPCE